MKQLLEALKTTCISENNWPNPDFYSYYENENIECILGEDMKDMSITSTLADRCAYTIGTNPIARKEARDKIKELYKARSKLLHGQDSENLNITPIHIWGQLALQGIINKEIFNYMLGG